MTYRNLQQGVNAIQQGNVEEGARLIKIALKSDEVQGAMRALGWIWLAETIQDREGKMRCYNEALTADPGNKHASERMALLMASTLPPTASQVTEAVKVAPPTDNPGQAPPPSGMPGQAGPAQAVDYNNMGASSAPQQQPPATPVTQMSTASGSVYRTIGIPDGVNGPGTGFLITRDGLMVTTRYVVGGMREITYELAPGQRYNAPVVRSFPEYDVAFISTGLQSSQLMPMTNTPHVPGNTPLTAYAHSGRVVSGTRRATKSEGKPEWLPTDIPEENLPDAGGNPVFNAQNMLIGMLTRNANRSAPYVFVLTLATIFQLLEVYQRENQPGQSLTYCHACGHLSRAAGLGGFYCEYCGAILPHAESVQRFPLPQMAQLYGEGMSQPCPNCGSSVGFHQGSCLRCGYTLPR